MRNQGVTKKTSSSTKRASSIHEEKKMVPNESAKPIITASGGVISSLIFIAHETW